VRDDSPPQHPPTGANTVHLNERVISPARLSDFPQAKLPSVV
jgi:hypothetical protein